MLNDRGENTVQMRRGLNCAAREPGTINMAMFSKLGAAGLVILLAGQTASAQDFFRRDRYESVRDRYQEAFDPDALRFGTFRLDSHLDLGVRQDDNVFADDTGEESDTIFEIAPYLNLNSDWSRHEVAATVDVRHREFSDLNSETTTDVRGTLRGRLDVGRNIDLDARAFASEETEPRFSAASLEVFEEPIRFQTAGAEIGARVTRSRLRARARLNVTDRQFDDADLIGGGKRSQDFRDYTDTRFSGRLSYAISPDLAVFTQAEGRTRDYDALSQIGDVEATRDSDGYSLQVGTNFELPFLVRGDIAVGYLEENKESDVFSDVEGAAVDARFFWFPTRLTTVEVEGSRRVVDPGLVEAGSATSSTVRARVDHELLRNVILFAEGRYNEEAFEDIDRDDETFGARLGATYKLNKRFHIDGFFERSDRSSNLADREFERNIFGIKLRVHP